MPAKVCRVFSDLLSLKFLLLTLLIAKPQSVSETLTAVLKFHSDFILLQLDRSQHVNLHSCIISWSSFTDKFFSHSTAVYALWKVPYLLPAFTLKGGEVSRFILGGADLMFPGIHIPEEGFVPFSDGEPWAVVVPGNPAPIAVSCINWYFF